MTERASESIVAVVDDDPGVLRSLEYLLESADYSALLYASGSELLDSGRLQQIDCLISDMEMPGMNGYELLRRVRAARPDLPAIFITGYPETLSRLSATGITRYRCFSKPFQGPDLLLAVSESIARFRE
jgi:FixJ family two-component response regulator